MGRQKVGILGLSLCVIVSICAGCAKDDEPSSNSVDVGAETGPDTPDDGIDLGEPLDMRNTVDMSMDDMTSATDGGEDAGADMDVPDMSAPNFDETSRSGSRLRRMYLTASEGAAMTVAFYDTLLDVPCTFREAADGTTRCLPIEEYLSELHFVDDLCTEPVHVVSETYCQENWSVDLFTQRIYRGTQTPAVLAGGTFIRGTSGVCQGLVTPSPDNEYFVAEQVPSGQFVRGIRRDEARAGGLVARYFDGEDGSMVLSETLHATLGYACDFATGRCLPASRDIYPNANFGARFADSGCTQPAYGYFGNVTPPLIGLPQNNCATTVEYRERGLQVPADGLYRLDGTGSCVPASEPNYTFYRVGNAISLTSFPMPDISLEGVGPVVARRHRDSDGAPLGTPFEFYDTATDEPCSPFETLAGEAVCVPQNVARILPQFHADSGCLSPGTVGTKFCDPLTPATVAEFYSAGNCTVPGAQQVLQAFQPGASTSSYYFQNNFVACEERSVPSDVYAWETGPDALSGLSRLSLATE